MIKQIFHIADLHIHERNYAHIHHAWNKLINAILVTPNYKTEALLVIAGDVFDHKTWLTAGDVSLFYSMMNDIEINNIRTIMMPGNHDYNINSSNGDKLLALVERSNYKYITYTSKSAIIVIENIAFFVHSPVDGETPRPTDAHKGLTTIAMVHEPLTNSKTCSGITFCQQRFSAEDFAVTFNMTMLGDIHMPQILMPNVAYSGSFVQKNRGEGIEHGYMLWNVSGNAPRFVAIEQLSVHLRIWAHDDTADALPFVVARSISLNHVNCTTEWITRFQKRIEDTYACKITSIFNKNMVESMDETKSVVERPTRNELNTIITKQLIELKVDAKQIGRIINHHHNTFEATPHEVSTDWRIRFLSWENVYCYGEKNHLNFDNIENLTSIVGPNKTGKSSIIDIIILVLFNESIRGAKKYALNVASNRGFIKCVISAGRDTYTIERAWIDPRTVAVRVYKNGKNVSGTDLLETYKYLGKIIGSKRVFVNSTAALQNRQFLVDIGPKDRYELVCRMMELDRLRVAEDDNKSELRTKCKEKDKLEEKVAGFSELEESLKLKHIEMIDVKSTLEKIDARINTIHARIGIISNDIIKDPKETAAQISEHIHRLHKFAIFTGGPALESCIETEKKSKIEIEDMKRDLNHVNKQYMSEIVIDLDDVGLLPQILENIAIAEKTDIGPIVTQLSDIKVQQCRLTSDVNTNEKTINYTRDLIHEKRNAINGKARELTLVKKDITESRGIKSNADLQSQVISLTVKNAEYETELTKILHYIESDLFMLTAAPLNLSQDEQKGALAMSIDEHVSCFNTLVRNIELVRSRIQMYHAEYITKQKNVSATRNVLTQHKAKMTTAANMKWATGCASCEYNRRLCGDIPLSSELEQQEAKFINELEEINTLELLMKTDNDHVLQLQNEMQRVMSCKLYYLYERKNNQEQLILDNNRAISKLQIEISMVNASNIAYQKLQDEYATALANDKIYNEISSLETQVLLLTNQIKTKRDEIISLEKQYAHAEKPMILVQTVQLLREQHATLLNNEKARKRKCELDAEIKDITSRINKHMEIYEQATRQIALLQTWKDNAEKLQYYKSIFDDVQASEDAMDEMNELNIESQELQLRKKTLVDKMAQLANTIGRLETNIETYRESMTEVAELTQRIEDMKVYDKVINHKTGVPKQLMINTCRQIEMRCNEIFDQISDFKIGVVFDKEIHVNTIHGDKVVSAEQSSGYQKFVIDLIMRQVLCSLTLAAHPRILFIDEGFGSLDAENFDIICKKVLPGLACQFEKVIIISHINGIHEHTSANCVIKNNKGRSQLQFGSMIPDGDVLRVIDDHLTSVKSSNEERALRKIDTENKKDIERAEKKALKLREEKQAELNARQKQNDFGESIIEDVDEHHVRCLACKKLYKKKYGFAQSHIKSKSHMKSMITFE